MGWPKVTYWLTEFLLLIQVTNFNDAGNEESVDANISNITASTSKNMQDNDMAFKDFFQPLLSHNLARSKVITAS